MQALDPLQATMARPMSSDAPGTPAEPRDHRIKRLAMRSMRRGIKEMDLILSAFAAGALADMDEAALTQYDLLLEENDHDIYAWINGQQAAPERYAALTAHIRVMAHGIVRPG